MEQPPFPTSESYEAELADKFIPPVEDELARLRRVNSEWEPIDNLVRPLTPLGHSVADKALELIKERLVNNSFLPEHTVAQVINTLRDVAINFHGTQQLRERIAGVIRPLLSTTLTPPGSNMCASCYKGRGFTRRDEGAHTAIVRKCDNCGECKPVFDKRHWVLQSPVSDPHVVIEGYDVVNPRGSIPDDVREIVRRIADWELPETGEFWENDKSRPMSYESCWGSNGVRDYMRNLALQAFELITKPTLPSAEQCKHRNPITQHTGDGVEVFYCPDCGKNSTVEFEHFDSADNKEWAKTEAGYAHVESVVSKANGDFHGAPWWHGWALREAFVAGAEWQEKRPSQPEMPFSIMPGLSQDPVYKTALDSARRGLPYLAYCEEMKAHPHARIGAEAYALLCYLFNAEIAHANTM